ncbi:Tetratricopeptide repeat protein 25 [Paragonimus heterotremus]|uniref:Outer dynein arm-docking complex subunit 4 n=1 Tax=Paragonimus heterotremus TaxID=100268 RepID=A0A8J4WI86_9TREM|nr:Tetratricopeptide repeat protein 25 [Paragonimus heterotremus]
MSRDSSADRHHIPKSTFEVYRSEGDSLLAKKKFTEAINCYTHALEGKEKDLHCLLKRSLCHSYLGNIEKALEDSDSALSACPDHYKALLQKAEVLYNKGDFEFALVYFHRGHKKRPERHEFRLGIQKCEEAIRNSLEDTEKLRITSSGAHAFRTQLTEKDTKRNPQTQFKATVNGCEQDDVPLHILPKAKSRIIFGYLHDEHEYLINLIRQENAKRWRTNYSEELSKIANAGLYYLDTRSKFWHQEKPIYARARARQKAHDSQAQRNKQQGLRICKVLKKLHEIDKYQHTEEHEIAVKMAEDLRQEVGQWSEDELPNRLEVLANVNSMLGLSQLELSRYEAALEAHTNAYELARQCNLSEIVSHAVDNIGRVHAKKGDYQSAIDVWQRKLDDCSDKFELIWLRYEIGRCHLELQRSEEALAHGDQALNLAVEVGDEPWQLNLNVLIGQANLHLRRRTEAQAAFLRAHELAKNLKATDAEKAILEVMDEFQSTECEFDTDSFSYSEVRTETSPVKRFTWHFQRNRAPPTGS